MKERDIQTANNMDFKDEREPLERRQVSFEIFPTPSIAQRVIDNFTGSKPRINVTSSNDRGIDYSLNIIEKLVLEGFEVVPHIGSNEVENQTHLNVIIDKLDSLRIDDVFFVKGEGHQKGLYKNSRQLLKDVAIRSSNFRRIGVAGYPEGISGMNENVLHKGIVDRKKVVEAIGAEFYVVTQMCFDPNKIVDYAESLRNELGIPTTVGLPVPELRPDLFRIAERCRVGASKEILLSGSQDQIFDPIEIVQPVSVIDVNKSVRGFHIYSFNQVANVKKWIDSNGVL